MRETPNGPAKMSCPPFPSAMTVLRLVAKLKVVLSRRSPAWSPYPAPSSKPVLRKEPALMVGLLDAPELSGSGTPTSSPLLVLW